MPCLGNAKNHCCWVGGKPCPFLIENYTDETGYFRRWACSLRAKYGNWDDVIADPLWQTQVGDVFGTGMNCRDWPNGEGANHGVCKDCGVNC